MLRLLRALGFGGDRDPSELPEGPPKRPGSPARRTPARAREPDRAAPGPVPSEPEAQRPDRHVTPEMALKLFGPPLEPAPPSVSTERDEPVYTYPRPRAAPKGEPTLLERAASLAHVDPTLKALLAATLGGARRRLADKVPGLGEPKPFLSELENELLARVYVEGTSLEAVGAQVGLGRATVKRTAREALLRAVYYAAFPDEAADLVPHPDHLALGRFVLAKSVEERRFTAKRHPKLLAASGRLPEREAMVLRLRHLHDLTLAEVGEHLGVQGERVRQLENKALRRLKYHYNRLTTKGEGHGPNVGEKTAFRPLLLGHAATAVSVRAPEVLDCLAKLGVFENPTTAEPAASDPRVLALQAAPDLQERRAVFAAFPELRPPHGFLTTAENRLLEWLYVRGAAYEGVQRALGVSDGRVAQLEERVLVKLAYYLAFEMLLSFPGDDL